MKQVNIVPCWNQLNGVPVTLAQTCIPSSEHVGNTGPAPDR